MFYRSKKEKLDVFYLHEIKQVYEIIKNDEIKDKLSEIEKIGSIKRFEKSLGNKYYTYFGKQLKEINEWYKSELESRKKQYEESIEGNQYSEEYIESKLEELKYLNRLYEYGNLNANTFYPIFKESTAVTYYDFKYEYLYKSKKIDFNNPKIKRIFENLPEINKKIQEIISGTSLKNLKYRKVVESILENEKYLENYQYAEYIIEKYIEEENSYNTNAFSSKYNIDDDKLNYCIKLVKFLNPTLYKEYNDKKELNKELRLNAVNMAFINLANDIRKYYNDGSELPVLEYLKQTPFKNNGTNYFSKVCSFIKNEDVYKTITEYIVRNKIKSFNNTSETQELKMTRTINGVTLTQDDTKNVFKIMRAYELPQIDKVYLIVARKYVNGEYNMEEISKLYNKMVNKQKKETIKIPHEYVKVIR